MDASGKLTIQYVHISQPFFTGEEDQSGNDDEKLKKFTIVAEDVSSLKNLRNVVSTVKKVVCFFDHKRYPVLIYQTTESIFLEDASTHKVFDLLQEGSSGELQGKAIEIRVNFAYMGKYSIFAVVKNIKSGQDSLVELFG